MTTDAKSDVKGAAARGGLLVRALLASIAGAGAGLVGAVFRLALQQADQRSHAATDAGRVLRGHAGADLVAQRADLRIVGRHGFAAN